ncbi:MAG: ABC transporter ATP-binding protein [Actinobacteria bacterium]|nr:ABC transporter ATP-binding protein [Actinomycetota bacterium]
MTFASTTTVEAPVLEVDDLHVDFDTPAGVVHAVRGVSFSVAPGETIGIVGESGSGKSVTARAIMRLLPVPPARVTRGRVLLDDHDLLTVSKAEMRAHRGADIAMVYQDPIRALNPTMRIGDQIVEAIRAHDHEISRDAAHRRAVELLDAVQIPAAAARARTYPHQLSGGMRQRVVIAMALSSDPRVLIAAEPTTALDVTVQAQILDLLADLQTERRMALVLVTHDLGVAAWHTHRVLVMYAGRIVEEARTDDLFAAMRMPYTRALFDSIPRLDRPAHQPLPAIHGKPPDMHRVPPGCPFHPRCSRATEICGSEAPPETRIADGHRWSCWHPLDVGALT